MTLPGITPLGSALFSDCRTYRYALWRTWGPTKRVVMFIGLNPSTADETIDDPTIRRCMRFARDWGYDGMVMTNLFAYRATNPADMRAAADPIGPDNDHHLCRLAATSAIVIAAWGAHGGYMGRDRAVMDMVDVLHCLKLTRGNSPAHPLYLRADLRPMLYRVAL